MGGSPSSQRRTGHDAPHDPSTQRRCSYSAGRRGHLGLFTWAAILALPGGASRLPRVAPPPATDNEVGNWLTRVGLDAPSLAAAGVVAASVDGLVADARTHLGAHIEALRNADNAVGEARAEVDRLMRLVQSGLATEQEVADIETARGSLASTTQSRAALAEAFKDAASDGLEPAQVAMLETLQSQRDAGWDLPVQYLAIAQSEEDRLQLRSALAHKKISERLEQPVSQAATAYLNTINANQAVVAASQGLVNLEAVTTAWNDAVHPEP